jgi:hypothetical protein
LSATVTFERRPLVRELNRLRECSRTIVEAHMPSHALRIAADANVAGLAALIDALNWPHRELARLAVQGAPVWDPIDGGVYRPILPKLTPAEAARCQANLTAHAEAVRRQVDGRVRRAAVDRYGQFTTAADAVRNCTKKERDKNLLVGPLTWRDVQRVCPEGAIPMPRFAKLELKETGPAYRCIDDGQWVGINNCTRTTETIANPSCIAFPSHGIERMTVLFVASPTLWRGFCFSIRRTFRGCSMNGLGGLNKSPEGVVIGLVQLQLPTVVTP